MFLAILYLVTLAILVGHSTLKQFVCGKNEYLWNHDFNDYQNNFLQAESESHALLHAATLLTIVKPRTKSAFKKMHLSMRDYLQMGR